MCARVLGSETALLLACAFGAHPMQIAQAADSRTKALVGEIASGQADRQAAALEKVKALSRPEMGNIAVPLAELLSTSQPGVQAYASKALQVLGRQAKSAIPDLLEAMEKAFKQRQPESAEWIGCVLCTLMGNEVKDFKAVFDSLKDAVRTDDAATYEDLMLTLMPKGASSVRTLTRLLKDGKPELRLPVVLAMQTLGRQARRAIPVLARTAANADPDLLAAIQKALDLAKVRNKAPKIESIRTRCVEGGTVSIRMSVTDFDDTILPLRVEISTRPDKGMARCLPDKPLMVEYAAPSGFTGEVEFGCVADDGKSLSTPGTCVVEIMPDKTPAQITKVEGIGSGKVRVAFNEQMNKASAETAAKYRVSPGGTVTAAALEKDGKAVLLSVKGLKAGAAFKLTASGVADASEAGNTCSATVAFKTRAELPGLRYSYFELASQAELVDPNKGKAKLTGVAKVINHSLRKRESNYALDFQGLIEIPNAGVYSFFTASDDGSFLWIDGKKIVDNGGWHGTVEKGGKVKLSPGPHKIRVYFFQGGGGHSLQVLWQGPGIKKQVIPVSVMKHRP